MNKRYLLFCLSGVLALLIVYVSVTNGQTVTVSLFGSSTAVPLGVLSIISFVAGILAGLPQMHTRARELKSEQIQVEWQNQDAKLQQQITSDKEKQLEAKIETLEAALKQALKKK